MFLVKLVVPSEKSARTEKNGTLMLGSVPSERKQKPSNAQKTNHYSAGFININKRSSNTDEIRV